MGTSRTERGILSVGTSEPGVAERCCSTGHLPLRPLRGPPGGSFLSSWPAASFAGPLLTRRKPEHTREAEGLYPITPCQEEREDGTSAWKRGAKRGKSPERSALGTGRAQYAFAPSLLSTPPLPLPNRAGCERQHPSTRPAPQDTLPDYLLALPFQI